MTHSLVHRRDIALGKGASLVLRIRQEARAEPSCEVEDDVGSALADSIDHLAEQRGIATAGTGCGVAHVDMGN